MREKPQPFPIETLLKMPEASRLKAAHDLAQMTVNEAISTTNNLDDVNAVAKFFLEYGARLIAVVGNNVIVNNYRSQGKSLAFALEMSKTMGADAGVNITDMIQDYVKQAYNGEAKEEQIKFKDQ